MTIPRGLADIERTVTSPVVASDWSDTDAGRMRQKGSQAKYGFREEFRALKGRIRAMRRRLQTPEYYAAAEIAEAFLHQFEIGMFNPDYFWDRDVNMTYNVLNDFAKWQEHRAGHINSMAQAVLRDAMHDVARERVSG